MALWIMLLEEARLLAKNRRDAFSNPNPLPSPQNTLSPYRQRLTIFLGINVFKKFVLCISTSKTITWPDFSL